MDREAAYTRRAEHCVVRNSSESARLIPPVYRSTAEENRHDTWVGGAGSGGAYRW